MRRGWAVRVRAVRVWPVRVRAVRVWPVGVRVVRMRVVRNHVGRVRRVGVRRVVSVRVIAAGHDSSVGDGLVLPDDGPLEALRVGDANHMLRSD